MPDVFWEILKIGAVAIAGMLSGGGVIYKILVMRMQERKEDRDFISDQFRLLLAEEQRRNTEERERTAEERKLTLEARRRQGKLEEALEEAKDNLADAIETIIKLGATWEPKRK